MSLVPAPTPKSQCIGRSPGFKGPQVRRVQRVPRVQQVQRVRQVRDQGRWRAALDEVGRAAKSTDNLVPPIIDAVESQATVGEIADTLRSVFGEYREVSLD